jgi:proteasome lid subunit RPN8/RPN11
LTLIEILRLPSSLLGAIVDHARAVLPAEAVGLLGGHAPDFATFSLPLPNRAGPYAYLADPWAQFQAERLLAARGYQLVAVYHSHPGGGAQLSPLDLAFARQRACLQVVIALPRSGLPGEDVRVYRVTDGTAVEVQLDVEP